MKMFGRSLIISASFLAGGCQPDADAEARSKLQEMCKTVYHDVLKIANCENLVETQYALEQRYRPGDPDKTADKVLADLFPSDAENEERRRRQMSDPNYSGPPPSPMYQINNVDYR